MLVIRFFRTGKKGQAFFKIVVTEKQKSATKGRFVEEVGFYNPLTKEKNVKSDRVKYWLSVGAQPSDTVHNLLISEKVIEGKKIPVHAKAKKNDESKDLSLPSSSAEVSVKEEKPAEEKKEEKPAGETPKAEEVQQKEEAPEEDKSSPPSPPDKDSKKEEKTQPETKTEPENTQPQPKEEKKEE